MAKFKHFRVYPEPKSKLYFHVRIFPSKRAFQRYYRLSLPTVAIAHSRKRFDPNTDRLSALVGWVSFYRQAIDVDTVAHEMLHAALFYLHRKKIPELKITEEANRLEERICYALGSLCEQFYKKAKQIKLL